MFWLVTYANNVGFNQDLHQTILFPRQARYLHTLPKYCQLCFFYIKRDLQKKIKKHKTAKFILNCKNKIKVQLCALLRSVPQLVAQLASWQCQNWFPLINDIPHTHPPFFPPKNKTYKKNLMKTAHRFVSNGTDKITKMTTK